MRPPRLNPPSIVLMGILLLAPALLLPVCAPPASGATVVLDRFITGEPSVNVTFGPRPWNDSAAIQLPYGSHVRSASLTARGIQGPSVIYSPFDLSAGAVGSDGWAMSKGGRGLYPPGLDPYTAAWDHIDAAGLAAVGADDGSHWETLTDDIDYTEPWMRSIQVYQFNPDAPGSPGLEVVWNGYGRCSANKSNEYQGELWLYDHSSRTWQNMTGYMTNTGGDVWLNATVEAGSTLWAENGSIAVAVVSPESLAVNSYPVARADHGHLHTDYIGLRVREPGSEEYASDVNLTVGGTTFVLGTGPMTGTVVLGDAQGLGAAIQAVVDSHPVRAGDLTVPLNLSVSGITMAGVELGSLRVEYDPPVNHAPAWVGPAEVAIREDSQWTDVLTLEAAFTDDFNQGDLSYALVSVSDGANLSVELGYATNGTRTVSVRPAPDFFGEVLVRVNATDLFGASTESPPITVRVTQVPDRPVLEGPGPLMATEGVPFNTTMRASDADLPDDVLAFSADWSAVSIDAATGRIDWTPGKGDVGMHAFNVTVTDRFGLAARATVRINVLNVNDPPVIVSPLAIAVDEGQAASYDIVAQDPDLPFGDALYYYAISEQIEVGVDMATGRVTFTPTDANVGTLNISIRVQDRAGLKDERTLVVTVANVNDPPVLDAIGDQTRSQGDTVSVQLHWTDPDLAVAGAGEHVTLTSDGPEWLRPDASGLISFTADQSKVGVWYANYTVSDAAGLSSTEMVLWTILDVNDLPVITTVLPGVVAAVEGQPFTFTFAATDLDGDALAWSDDSPLFAIGVSTGAISFTPKRADAGAHRVTVTVSDGRGGTANATFDLTVASVNHAPVITNVAPLNGTSYDQGETISFMATATDSDGDALTYIWKEGGIELGRGSTLKTSLPKASIYTITLVVSDGNTTVERQLQVRVRDLNDLKIDIWGHPLLDILLFVVVGAVVVIAVGVMAMRSRKGRPPVEQQQTASLAGSEGAAGAPGAKAPEGEEPPKIEMEYREA